MNEVLGIAQESIDGVGEIARHLWCFDRSSITSRSESSWRILRGRAWLPVGGPDRERCLMANKSQKKRSPKTNKPKLTPKQKKAKKNKKAGVKPAN